MESGSANHPFFENASPRHRPCESPFVVKRWASATAGLLAAMRVNAVSDHRGRNREGERSGSPLLIFEGERPAATSLLKR